MNQTLPTFRSYESKILYMNGMYNLPIAPFPTAYNVAMDYKKRNPGMDTEGSHFMAGIRGRLKEFKKILLDEVSEVDEMIQKMEEAFKNQKHGEIPSYSQVDFLTDMSDWLGDLRVYIDSEAVRYGIPMNEVLDIIMQSNFSKLDENGLPIIKDGKFQKGPFYWKPEAKIKLLLEQRIRENDDFAFQKS